MAKYGLIGDPIATSRSPLLFEAAYKGQEQPDGDAFKYDLIEGSDFETSFKKFIDEYQAINVTAPFKELAYALLMEHELGKDRILELYGHIRAADIFVACVYRIDAEALGRCERIRLFQRQRLQCVDKVVAAKDVARTRYDRAVCVELFQSGVIRLRLIRFGNAHDLDVRVRSELFLCALLLCSVRYQKLQL